MDYTPVTPFRRPIDAAILQHQAASAQDLPPEGVNKWEVLRELATARVAFGLTDRDLAVLQALVSFHPATVLGGNDPALVVHPSNRAICERLNGMPSSTMRRHLAALVQAGVVTRRDSPNGKRYARRYGDEKVAFGFDLGPLVLRFGEICAASEQVRATEERVQRLRTTVSLMRRDLAGLADYGRSLRPDLGLWDECADRAALMARALRRKLTLDELTAAQAALEALLDRARDTLGMPEPQEMSTNDGHFGHHQQNSNKDLHVLEPCFEKAKVADAAPEGESDSEGDAPDPGLPNIPLGLVLAVCTEIQIYSETPVRHWHQFVTLADIVRPMLGISPSAWEDARRHMGPEQAAVVLASMLERLPDIRSPGGYLRALTDRAAAGSFSCGPMVMALMRKSAA